MTRRTLHVEPNLEHATIEKRLKDAARAIDVLVLAEGALVLDGAQRVLPMNGVFGRPKEFSQARQPKEPAPVEPSI